MVYTLSYYYKSYYYNKYNKQLVNDDSYDKSDIGYTSIHSKPRNDYLDSYFGISSSYIPYSIGYSLTFFFERRQHHYVVINDLILSPIISIKNNYNRSCLFDYLRLNELGDLNGVVYDDAKIHLKKHRRDLPKEIEDIQQSIKEHNLEVEKLEKMIYNFVKSKYTSRPYNSTFPYHFTIHIQTQSLKIWFDSIANIKFLTNMVDIKKNIDIEIKKSIIGYRGERNHILNINEHEIGNGNYMNSAHDIEKIFTDLLNNDEILEKLAYLVNSNLTLNKNIDIIVNDVSSISESIKKGYYDKKLSCCPQLFKLPRRR
jgi:hypothetical protein